MELFQSCNDMSDIKPFYSPRGLYLKPSATIHISVQLPTLRASGPAISSKAILEKIKARAAPDVFCSLKSTKIMIESMRFEGEIQNSSKCSAVLARLNGASFALEGFNEPMKVRASPAKPDFPTKHDWDSFFRDAKNMNEMKAGERPDTIYLSYLPVKWFSSKSTPDSPSETALRKTFEQFGEITAIDIPCLDPYRPQMKPSISGLREFHHTGLIFEAYIQFKDYFAFVKAMDTLRGMKLLKKIGCEAFSANIKVDFDKTKHLSLNSIRRRIIERDKLLEKDREKDEAQRKLQEEQEALKQQALKEKQAQEEAKLIRRREREARRKARELDKLRQHEANDLNRKIATEEKLLVIAQRKLESIRLLTELFNRVKETKQKEWQIKMNKRSNRFKPRQLNQDEIINKDQELKKKIVQKFRNSNGSSSEVTVKSLVVKDPPMEREAPRFLDRMADDNDENEHTSAPGGSGNWPNNNWRGRRGNWRGPWRGRSFGGRLRGGHSWFAGKNHLLVPPELLLVPDHDVYYRYFKSIAGRRSRSRDSRRYRRRRYSSSRSRSRSRSYSRSRTRSRSRSRSRRSRTRSRSRSKSRKRSSWSRSASKDKYNSPNRWSSSSERPHDSKSKSKSKSSEPKMSSKKKKKSKKSKKHKKSD